MPNRPPVKVGGEAVCAVVCATLVRDIQAMQATRADDDKSADESEAEPGTLYFGQEDGWTARSS